jgi:hypothetical protein
MEAEDGKMRMTDAADAETLLRLIQSVPSPKAGQETRNKLTDYWKDHEINKEEEYAILTNIIHEELTDVSIKEHKKLKGLKTQNLRDYMSEAELIFTALAELSTRQIAETTNATGMKENKIASKLGGGIAKKDHWPGVCLHHDLKLDRLMKHVFRSSQEK